MFMSLENDYSVQEVGRNGYRYNWQPVKDKAELLRILVEYDRSGTTYRVAGTDGFFNAIMVTHRFCERMIWGFECFGKGVNQKIKKKFRNFRYQKGLSHNNPDH